MIVPIQEEVDIVFTNPCVEIVSSLHEVKKIPTLEHYNIKDSIFVVSKLKDEEAQFPHLEYNGTSN